MDKIEIIEKQMELTNSVVGNLASQLVALRAIFFKIFPEEKNNFNDQTLDHFTKCLSAEGKEAFLDLIDVYGKLVTEKFKSNIKQSNKQERKI